MKYLVDKRSDRRGKLVADWRIHICRQMAAMEGGVVKQRGGWKGGKN